jgi:hypothetical protein
MINPTPEPTTESVSEATTESVSEPTVQLAAAVDTDPDKSETTHEKNNREAAKYRVALREKESQLETALSRVENLQRMQVLALSGSLSEPADIFDVGKIELSELFDDAGNIDEGKVIRTVAALLDSRPGLRRPKFAHVEMGSQGTGHAEPRTDLASLISGKLR